MSVLSGKAARLLHILIKGKAVDAEGKGFPLRSEESRLLWLIRNGYLKVEVTEKAFDELAVRR